MSDALEQQLHQFPIRIGPVWNIDDYNVALRKDGYEFETRDQKLFKAIKLSELQVEFTDSETHKPLADVLISLSGGSSYRSNNFTDAKGKINYIGLVCVHCFIRRGREGRSKDYNADVF